MAPESRDSSAHREEHAAHLAQADAAHREAYNYWGYLFKEDKCGMPLLDRLLKGIAEVIVSLEQPVRALQKCWRGKARPADGDGVEQAIRAERVCRPDALAACGVVSRCGRRL